MTRVLYLCHVHPGDAENRVHELIQAHYSIFDEAPVILGNFEPLFKYPQGVATFFSLHTMVTTLRNASSDRRHEPDVHKAFESHRHFRPTGDIRGLPRKRISSARMHLLADRVLSCIDRTIDDCGIEVLASGHPDNFLSSVALAAQHRWSVPVVFAFSPFLTPELRYIANDYRYVWSGPIPLVHHQMNAWDSVDLSARIKRNLVDKSSSLLANRSLRGVAAQVNSSVRYSKAKSPYRELSSRETDILGLIWAWMYQGSIGRLNARDADALAIDSSHQVLKQKPLLLLSLHSQPEGIHTGRSPLLADQVNLIRHVRNCLPGDSLLLVKEHPHQDPRIRPPLFYRQILEAPQVMLLKRTCPIASLLEDLDIRAVVSVAGTPLAQAAAQGVPAVALDNSYLSSLPGVITADAQDSSALGSVIHKAFAGEMIAQEDCIDVWLDRNRSLVFWEPSELLAQTKAAQVVTAAP